MPRPRNEAINRNPVLFPHFEYLNDFHDRREICLISVNIDQIRRRFGVEIAFLGLLFQQFAAFIPASLQPPLKLPAHRDSDSAHLTLLKSIARFHPYFGGVRAGPSPEGPSCLCVRDWIAASATPVNAMFLQ